MEGLVYWSQVDGSAEIRVYQEDRSHTAWDLLAANREELGRC